MSKVRIGAGLTAGCLLLCGLGNVSLATTPTPAEMLSFRPRQDGVVYTIPTAQEAASCKVERIKGQRKGSGWLLRDNSGKVLRVFFDSNEDNRIDIWSYYKDGAEVYREIASTFGKHPDQYRWLNSGGMKWGVDTDGDGKIDFWKMISAEEASQEVVQGVLKQDFHRLQSLMVTDSDLKALDLPSAEVERIRNLRKGTAVKFQKTVNALTNFSPNKTHWLHLETQSPRCLPSEQGGRDVVFYQGGTILCETAGKNEWLQIGMMIQVGMTWRLTDAPSPGVSSEESNEGGSLVTDQELQKLLDQLRELDARMPKGAEGEQNGELARYNLERAEMLEKIVAKAKAEDRDPWIRQVADSLSAAAQHSSGSDKKALTKLNHLESQVVEAMPGSTLAAYVTYREMSADYGNKLMTSKPAELTKIQEAWLERLAKFVQTYAKSDDTADALLQLGMVNEFLGKEIEAKNWYSQLARDFADKPQGPKGAGAVRRLESEGKILKLASPTLNDSNTAFDIDQLRGKLVVVYYWASYGQNGADFVKLKTLLDAHNKQVALVCVNLDNTVEEAKNFISTNQVPGLHIYQPGGLESKLATEYGVMVLPSMFLVGKDGKVLSRSVQIGNLEEEIKKALK